MRVESYVDYVQEEKAQEEIPIVKYHEGHDEESERYMSREEVKEWIWKQIQKEFRNGSE